MQSTTTLRRTFCAFSLALAGLFLAGCGTTGSLPASLSMFSPVERAMWVTRFDYQTPHDIEKIAESCELAGLNTILFQVRGNATVSYHSALEPWSERFGWADPGFDPLATAIEAAQRRGLKLKAWVNVVPAWWGTDPPTDTRHVWHMHKDWLWYDQTGKLQPFADKFYVSLNPCLPEVRRHLASVMRDLVARYRVDGVHLDYIRFPNDLAPAGTDYPRDARTVGLFRGENGKTPEQDPEGWNAWRTEQVTNLLREIRRQLRQERPDLELSAAVGPEPERARDHHFQDVRTWAREDLVDVLYPMNYTKDPAVFQRRVAAWEEIADDTRVVMGLRVDSDDVQLHERQLSTALQQFRGFAVFAYSSLFDSPNDVLDDQAQETRARRQDRRAALLPVFKRLARGGGELD